MGRNRKGWLGTWAREEAGTQGEEDQPAVKDWTVEERAGVSGDPQAEANSIWWPGSASEPTFDVV